MKILFASDSFKGSLSSQKIIHLLERAAKKVFPDCETHGILVGDGGEGTVEAVLQQTEGLLETVFVSDPLMREISATYGVVDETTAILEMAAASGLPLLDENEKNPLLTSSYGTGQMINALVNKGFKHIIVGLGGSASNDGGMGAMRALGVRFLDEHGHELPGRGCDLINVHNIDASGLHPNLAKTQFTVLSDVTNPLTGLDGATMTFGAQKGAGEKALRMLEEGMLGFAKIINNQFGVDLNLVQGAGAAGGLGGAMHVFLAANIQSGVETVLDMINFDSLLGGVDLVVTGEGQLDWQSQHGKVVSGVAQRCKSRGIPAIAIVGSLGKGASEIYNLGIQSIMPIVDGPMSLEDALSHADTLYLSASERAFRLVEVGLSIGAK